MDTPRKRGKQVSENRIQQHREELLKRLGEMAWVWIQSDPNTKISLDGAFSVEELQTIIEARRLGVEFLTLVGGK
jgi:hypothetical protein